MFLLHPGLEIPFVLLNVCDRSKWYLVLFQSTLSCSSQRQRIRETKDELYVMSGD